MSACRIIVCSCLGILASTAAATAAEFNLVPVSADGMHSIVGNEITLTGSGQRVFFEIRLTGWAPDQLKAWQAVLDSTGYTSGAAGAIGPAFESCVNDADCQAVFPGSGFGVCNTLTSICAAGYIDTGRSDAALPLGAISSVDLATLNYRFGAALISGAASDDGSSHYGATLVLDIPSGASGTFTLGFDPSGSSMNDANSLLILPLDFFPATIIISCATAADCEDNDECTDDACTDGTCTNTSNFNAALDCCDPTNGALTAIDDGVECTDDVCNTDGSVDHNALADGSACGDPSDTECDPADTCLAGVCEANTEPSGAACGDAGDSECGNPDTCDGAGTCLGNDEPVGTACGDASDTDCDNPDTCDGVGTCAANNEPNGTTCDDGLFCNVNEACSSGACTGGGPLNCSDDLACTTDTCEEGSASQSSSSSPRDGRRRKYETLEAGGGGQCVNTLDPGNCLIAGMCLADGQLNSGNDCEECDSGLSTDSFSFSVADSACGDAGDTECDNPDTCDGSGTCQGNTEPSGIACGDSSDTDCDNPDTCDGAGACASNFEPSATACLDDVFCNGEEACDGAGTCQAGTFPCLIECDEKNNRCVDCLSNADCPDDGLFCTGEEVCGDGSCVQTGNPCPAELLCVDSDDTCKECLGDADCDDGLFCTGPEACVNDFCEEGDDPCPGVREGCDDQLDECFDLSGILYAEDFESYPAGGDATDWFDTFDTLSGITSPGIVPDDTKFKVFDLDGNKVLGTTANTGSLSSLNSTYVGPDTEDWSNYRYSGRMRTDGGPIGVKLVSKYPVEKKAFSLSSPGPGHRFQIGPRLSSAEGDFDTGVVPQAGVWFRFRIEVSDTPESTYVRAKVWEDGTSEPGAWQAEIEDYGESEEMDDPEYEGPFQDEPARLTKGRIGVFGQRYSVSSAQYWDDLQVATLICEFDEECQDGNACTIDVCGADGICVLEEADCDDGVSCTVDSCDDVQGCRNISICPGDQLCDSSGLCLEADGSLLSEDFSSYAVGDDPAAWEDRRGTLNFPLDDSLYEVDQVGADRVFGFSPVAGDAGIFYSTYVGPGSAQWSSYRITGRVRTTSVGAAAGNYGLSFMANQTPIAGGYTLTPHSGSNGIFTVRMPFPNPPCSTGVSSVADVWFLFKVEVEDAWTRNNIRVKVWREGSLEPTDFAECFDDSKGRAFQGTIRLFGAATLLNPATKFWDDIVVTGIACDSALDCDDGVDCTVDKCAAGQCVNDDAFCPVSKSLGR